MLPHSFCICKIRANGWRDFQFAIKPLCDRGLQLFADAGSPLNPISKGEIPSLGFDFGLRAKGKNYRGLPESLKTV
jgi:hypothetical protein